MSVTAEMIASYLDRYGWSYERIDDIHFASGFRSQAGEFFPVYVTLDVHWVFLAISPFAKAPSDTQREGELYRYLLQMCQRMNMAKFAVDSSGNIVLTVELPREHLDYDELVSALDALAVYATETSASVQTLVGDLDVVSPIAEEQDLDWGG